MVDCRASSPPSPTTPRPSTLKRNPQPTSICCPTSAASLPWLASSVCLIEYYGQTVTLLWIKDDLNAGSRRPCGSTLNFSTASVFTGCNCHNHSVLPGSGTCSRVEPRFGAPGAGACRSSEPVLASLRLTLRVAHSKSPGFTELLTGLRLGATPHPLSPFLTHSPTLKLTGTFRDRS